MGDSLWSQSGSDFHPGSTELTTNRLAPGVYEWGATVSGWFLRRVADNYAFPFKIYGDAHKPIVSRVMTAWKGLGGNLGVMLDGLKGTGKTVTAQLLCNEMIALDVPVLRIKAANTPIDTVLTELRQPVVVVFDEFEKVYEDRKDQRKLLTVLDGMGRSEHKRMWLFTTNKPDLDTNLVDRPSRIRYRWNFGRLGMPTVTEIVNDLLNPELSALQPPLLSYLDQRSVLSIDVVKAAVEEVNLFREGAHVFEPFMNLSRREPVDVTVWIIDASGNRKKHATFKPREDDLENLPALLTHEGYAQAMAGDGYWSELGEGEPATLHSYTQRIGLLGPVDEDRPSGPWFAHLGVSATDRRSWWAGLHSGHRPDMVWLSEKPEDWKPLETKNGVPTDREEWSKWFSSGTLYGNDPQVFQIQIEVNYPSASVLRSSDTASRWASAWSAAAAIAK